MSKRPSNAYITAKLDQIQAAARNGNGDAGVAVIAQIRKDGYSELASEILQRLTDGR